MERREFLGAGATATVGALAGTQVVGAAPAAADSGPERDSAYREAVRILKRVPLIDGHNDVPWQYRQRVGNRLNEIDLAEDTSTLDPPMHTDIPRLNDGHLGGQFWSVYVSPETTGPEGVKVQLDQLDIARRMFERYDEFEYVTTARCA